MKDEKITTIFIDFETQSNNDIRLGVNHYMACPQFRAYLLSYSIDGEKIKTYRPDTNRIPYSEYAENFHELTGLINIIQSGKYLIVSHNTNFDVRVWNKIFPDLQIDENKTFDTSWACRVLNVPASLEKVSKFFNLTESKDLEGKKVLTKYYKVVDISEEDFARITEYNRQDVKALIELYGIVANADCALDGNQTIYDLVQTQNEIKIDQGRLLDLCVLKNTLIINAQKKALKLFPTYKKSGEKLPVSIAYSANEIKKFLYNPKAYLETYGKLPFGYGQKDYFDLTPLDGVKLSSISKNKIEEELNLEGVTLDEEAQTLIDLYRVLQAKGLSKYDTFSEYFINNPVASEIKDFQISHGTHTGRPAGRGLQLHNISRPPKSIETMTSENVVKQIKREIKNENFLLASKYLSAILWSVMIPDSSKHVIARYDLSSIEPRVGAFLRNDEKLLEVYRQADLKKGKDEYDTFGERMNFPKDTSRQLSKIIILAACYGMGSGALRASMVNAGLPDIGDMAGKKLLSAYHELNPSVKKSWYALEAKFKLALINGQSVYNRIEFKRVIVKDKKFIAVILPSGRSKFYADCSISSNGKILYNDSRLGKIELRAYLLYENLVQASATDVLFLKAAEVEKIKDAKIKLTIYDELIVSTLQKNVETIKKIMGGEEEAYLNMPLSFKGAESFTFWKGDKV